MTVYKNLKNQTLLYDAGCPLCSVYTNGFIKAGMLDADGRKPYESLTDEEKQFVDAHRACNEIALIDNNNKTVTYGIDSLLKVLGSSFPLIEKVGKFKPVHWLLKKLYSFISYNRKAIMPNTKPATGLECLPDFNYPYRIAYIIFAGIITALALYGYSKYIYYILQGTIIRELILAFGQLVFQGIFLMGKGSKTVLNYFGNLMTVSLFGALLLLPMLVANHFLAVNPLLTMAWFLFIAAIMFFEHFRRVRLLALPGYFCITWVAYRAIALYIIIITTS